MTKIILNSDSYKYSMHVQYPSGTEYVYSYIESRGGQYDTMVFFGLQMFVDEYLMKPITKRDIDEAEKVILPHIGVFNRKGWEYILEKHKGYLPVEIRAVTEGVKLPVSNALVTIVNTDPECFWLTTFLETALLRAIWYPTTIATQGYHTKQFIKASMLRSGGSIDGLPFMLHDFGCRGVSSYESSAIGGLAHLVNFAGTDNIPALLQAKKYYRCETAGYSVPAMEHSTVTSWGNECELSSYMNMVEQYKDKPIVSCVSDSYDIFEACHMVGISLSQTIIDNHITYVIRPDSGDPSDVLIKCLDILQRYFPTNVNKAGYKVLEHVKLLWGDGINHDSIKDIANNVIESGYSLENIVFGSGGALLQQMNRDTMKFAMKCSAIQVNGQWRDVYKDPITDKGKRSKRGLVKLYYNGTNYVTATDKPDGYEDAMSTVYQDGWMCRRQSLDEIRDLVNS